MRKQVGHGPGSRVLQQRLPRQTPSAAASYWPVYRGLRATKTRSLVESTEIEIGEPIKADRARRLYQVSEGFETGKVTG